jgi:hypothetical protein
MQFYSNSKPDLIVPKVRNSVVYVIKKKSSFNTLSDKISDLISGFYDSYICDCKIIILLLAAIFVILLCRYYDKQNKISKGTYKDNKEGFSSEEDKLISKLLNDKTNYLEYNTQPSFNRLYSVNDQHEPVNYLPDPVPPINMPGKGLVYDNNLYPYSKPYENLNNPNYDYDNVYTTPSRSYYNGTYNPYKNAQDTNITNPMGFSNQFNSTTGNFVGGMTSANNQNITDYQKILTTMNTDLINSVGLGPESLNINELEPKMVPPYSTDM